MEFMDWITFEIVRFLVAYIIIVELSIITVWIVRLALWIFGLGYTIIGAIIK